jgi:hypothetical protein
MGHIRLKLVSGREYLFTHRRLKTIKARYVRIVRAPATDPTDEYYLECELTDLDPALRPPTLRPSGTILLRPSMITVMQNVPRDYSPRMEEFAARPTPRRGRPAGWFVDSVRSLLKSMRIP